MAGKNKARKNRRGKRKDETEERESGPSQTQPPRKDATEDKRVRGEYVARRPRIKIEYIVEAIEPGTSEDVPEQAGARSDPSGKGKDKALKGDSNTSQKDEPPKSAADGERVRTVYAAEWTFAVPENEPEQAVTRRDPSGKGKDKAEKQRYLPSKGTAAGKRVAGGHATKRQCSPAKAVPVEAPEKGTDNAPETSSSRDSKKRELVVITGASSFLGFATTLMAIESGYRVHALFRRIKSLKAFLRAFPPEYREHLRYTLLPILFIELDLDLVLRDADYIIHMASPPPWQPTNPHYNLAWQFVHPVNMVCFGILLAASESPRVKRIVFTSSIAAYFNEEELDGNQAAVRSIENEDQDPIEIFPDNLYKQKNKLVAYAIGRARALEYTDAFPISGYDAKFDIVHLLPSHVFGPNRMCRSREEFNRGSNAILLNHLLGVSKDRLFSASAHIDDVARCHVEALLPCVPPGRYILNAGYTHWPDAIRTVEKYHPELVGTLFAKDPPTKTTHCVVKKLKTWMTFALRFKNFEQQVRDTVDFYLSLPEKSDEEDDVDVKIHWIRTPPSSRRFKITPQMREV